MFTENEIAIMIDEGHLSEPLQQLKNDFIDQEAQFLEISDHDFLSLIMLTPSVGIALANGSISLAEEMALNKKARRLSKGGFFLKKDPVVYAMKYLIKAYTRWEDRFMDFIKLTIESTVDEELLLKEMTGTAQSSDDDFKKDIMNAPYMFVRYISSFFLGNDQEDIIDTKNVSRAEFEKIKELGEKLGLSNFPLFLKFCTKFTIK